MEQLLKEWRQDAMHKHQYETAIYIGDKLLALTGDANDAFFLAQVHFSTGNYTRALSFLTKHNLIDHSPACRYLAAHCQIKQNRFEDALSILGEKNPTHLIATSSKVRRKLQHTGNSVRNGQKSRANGRPDRIEKSEERDRESISDIKYEAGMCYLRGLCYAKQNAFDKAKECYKDAVRIDVQCFEAFDQLMKNSLMSPDEEWEFLESLEFDTIASSLSINAEHSSVQEATQFTKMLYTTRLSKYKNAAALAHATETLSSHYNLASNPDLLLSKADLLFTQCRFKQAIALTTEILASDPHNFQTLPLHLACLHELHDSNALFLLAHQLADSHPEEPATWLAVAIYYLSINQIAEARRFFSKASVMDPHFGPAWIGFAHTFAAEGEHDQAISAYSTAARLFQGTHLPQLFLGMQNLQLSNMTLAQEYLNASYVLCSTDPLLLNELGVAFFHMNHYPQASQLFERALAFAKDLDAEPGAWVSARANLGHAYRRQKMWNEALEQFEDVLRIGGKDGNVFTSKGLVLLEMGRPWDAVSALHEALSMSPQDPVATDILGRALEESAAQGGFGGQQSNGGVDDDDEGGGRTGVDDAVDEEFERIVAAGRREVGRMKIAKGRKAQMMLLQQQQQQQQQQQRQSPQATLQQQRPRVTQARSLQARERGSVGGDDPFTGGHGGQLGAGLGGTGGDESMLMSSDEE